MDDVAGQRRRKGDAFPPPLSTSASFPALTPRGPGLPLPSSSSSPSPSGSSFLPSPPPPDAAAAVILALPTPGASVSGSPPPASTLLAGAMDGGSGEALLVRRSKPKKRPPPTDAPHAARRESRGGDRSLVLWRDYHDLLKETEAKKRRLESKNRRKLRLLAEVKFLRRKYAFLAKRNSQQPSYKLKGQARQIQSQVGANEASALADHGAGPSTSKNTNLDLDQDSVMNNEGVDRRGHQGHPKPGGHFDQDGVNEEDTVTADVKFSACSTTGTTNSPSCEDKRTISWQDHLALQV